MNEVISGIRVIKMYAWEYAFRKVVTKLRRWENIHKVHQYRVSSKFIGYKATSVVSSGCYK